jgi:hypothetical protein
MGRPHVNDKDKRLVQVNIRLTEDEYKKVSTYASDSDLTPANWIRKKIFTGKFPSTKLSVIDSLTYQELRKIGVNLNQAIHKINEGEVPRFFLGILLDLKKYIQHILNLMIDDSKSDQG